MNHRDLDGIKRLGMPTTCRFSCISSLANYRRHSKGEVCIKAISQKRRDRDAVLHQLTHGLEPHCVIRNNCGERYHSA